MIEASANFESRRQRNRVEEKRAREGTIKPGEEKRIPVRPRQRRLFSASTSSGLMRRKGRWTIGSTRFARERNSDELKQQGSFAKRKKGSYLGFEAGAEPHEK